MKIALVHSEYSQRLPSGENYAVLLQFKALMNAGHHVRLITRSTDILRKSSLYKIRSTFNTISQYGTSPIKDIEKFSPDIVHIHNLFPNFGSSWIRELGIPVVNTIHNFRNICASGSLTLRGSHCVKCPSGNSGYALANRCYHGSFVQSIPLSIYTSKKGNGRKIVKNSHHIIYLSERFQKEFEFYVPEAGTKQNAIIPNFYMPPENSIKVSDNKRAWIYAGRLDEDKGIVDLVDRWRPEVPLIIAGSGPAEKLITRNIEGRNIELVGLKTPNEIYNLMKVSRGIVLPSLCSESAPSLSYLQALAAGALIVSTSESAISDDITVANSGIVVSSIGEMAEICASNLDIEVQLRTNALQRFNQNFTESIWLERMTSFYEHVLSAKD